MISAYLVDPRAGIEEPKIDKVSLTDIGEA